MNILVDDVPRPQQVTIEFEGSAKMAMDKVSEAFDYSWKQKSDDVIVMYKRFHSAGEHPQYNIPELRRMAHDVTDIFKAINIDPDDDFTTRTNALFGLLTPSQVEMLQAGKMLHGSDLTAQQADVFQVAILQNMFFGQVAPWRELALELDGLDHSVLSVIELPSSLRLNFSLKAADGTEFSRFLAGTRTLPSSTEAKKP